MASLDNIKAPVKNELEEFNRMFGESIKSSTFLLDKIIKYILKQKGKQIRPLFVFLSAKLLGEINKSTYTAASLIELLHTATLIHDDVVDDSYERRGFLSLNAIWKNKISVLAGDYLLSKGLILALENQDYYQLKIVSDAVKEMSEGELLQIEKSRFLNMSEAVYFEIIRKKTASLISSCCACGASSVTDDKEKIELLRKFGELAGIAFQIKDDLLDFEQTGKTGKPAGMDLKEKKLSLPVIFMLNNMGLIEKRKMANIIKNHGDNKEKLNLLIEKIKKSGGMEYATDKMNVYKNEALEILKSFPKSETNDSLQNLVKFIIERTY